MKSTLCGMALLFLFQIASYSQSSDGSPSNTINFPDRLVGKLGSRIKDVNEELTQQTEKYLLKMQRREEKMQNKLSTVDSNGAKQVFAGGARQYAALRNKVLMDTGSKNMSLIGAYVPYVDSLKGALCFLQKNPGLMNAEAKSKLTLATSQFQILQARMADADQVKAFIQQRKQQISQ